MKWSRAQSPNTNVKYLKEVLRSSMEPQKHAIKLGMITTLMRVCRKQEASFPLEDEEDEEEEAYK